jgi:hypothetical protein
MVKNKPVEPEEETYTPISEADLDNELDRIDEEQKKLT